ncbi:hypothetical protein CY34DRAFT_640437 [Suillus luteus UH-Slu-Lm8-n1]|uniref:Uncharacterized protein n=1 Tax=Suillus luteus UH-Slu-Lm8-n1 TaxID=930992 RepID=A0A0D0A2R0_9AGAM|nr:hypothetical protein CY34DRAFT_640437 [Suillus luteus UH-Slu-Lm8-n1]
MCKKSAHGERSTAGQRPLCKHWSSTYNLIRPVLSQRFRFVRCSTGNAKPVSEPVGELLAEDDTQNNPLLSNEDITNLVAFSSSAQELERLSAEGILISFYTPPLICSIRMKDQRSSTNQLSLAESTRYQKVMHKSSLVLNSVYGNRWLTGSSCFHSEGYCQVQEAVKLRKGFFRSFSTLELREIRMVESFLLSVLAPIACCS